MPTENRPYVAMISVPERLLNVLKAPNATFAQLRDARAKMHDFLTSQPAEQHQGEPVAWTNGVTLAWMAKPNSGYAQVSATKAGAETIPLFTHPAPADAGEVERLREALGCALKSAENINAEVIALNAKLAERDALPLQTMLHAAKKIYERVNAAATEYEQGKSALGFMEDAAEAALYLRNALSEALSASAKPEVDL